MSHIFTGYRSTLNQFKGHFGLPLLAAKTGLGGPLLAAKTGPGGTSFWADQFWQPKLVWADQFCPPKLVRGTSFGGDQFWRDSASMLLLPGVSGRHVSLHGKSVPGVGNISGPPRNSTAKADKPAK